MRLLLEAAKAAEAGDDGAAHELFEITLRCGALVGTIRKGATREEIRARIPSPDPVSIAASLAEFDYCAPIASAPELADWQPRNSKLSATYWRQQAERLGNPTMLTSRFTSNAFNMPRAQGAAREALLAQLSTDLKTILRSGDGEGWYQLGMQASYNLFSSDPAAGLALALASCDLGYDCTKNNRRNIWGHCQMSNCAPVDDLAQFVRDNYSSADTGRAYEKLLELKELLRQQNWDAIEQFVKPDGRLMQPGYRGPGDGYDDP